MAVELLAPAGDLERLKIAIQYGADAVYFGGKQFSLRARASNFDLEDIKAASEYAHLYNRKAYVTVNMIPHNNDFEGLEAYLKKLEEFKIDAIICASPAIGRICKRVAPSLEVHISTQQTTVNSQAVAYWQAKGADRVVLGREVTYEQLTEIMKQVNVPIEVFIHGGMCANYSGRCTISNMLTNRDANRGGCAQSCRWNFHLYKDEELLDRDDTLLSMGSKDLCTPEWIVRLLEANVASLKIEGRMKTGFYLASVVKAYRLIIDSYYASGKVDLESYNEAIRLLKRVANRETFAGFWSGKTDRSGQLYNNPNTASQVFLANIKDYDEESQMATIEVRNYFKKGDKISILNPEGFENVFVVEKMVDVCNNDVEIANKPMQILKLQVPVAVNQFSFLVVHED